MARIAQPLEVAKLKGADKKNPQRYRAKPPKSALPLGDAPGDFTESESACWFELSAYSLPGVMTGADRVMLEVLSCLLAEYRSDRRGFPVGKYSHLISCMARFGMSPSDRTKLGVEDKKKGNYFANLDD